MPEITLSPVRDVAALGPRWRALQSASDATPFQTWSFVSCRAAARYTEPFLLSAQENGTDVALGLLNRAGGKLYLHATGDPEHDAIFVEHSGLLVARRHQDVIGGALRHLAAHGPVVLAGADDRYFDAAQRAGVVTHHQKRFAPCVDLRAMRGSYLANLSANARTQLRRAARLAGGIDLHRAAGSAEALAWLREMIGLHEASWQARGKTGAFASPAVRAFHEALIGQEAPDPIADLLRVTAGGTVLGVLYNLRHAGHVCCYQSGFRAAGDPRVKPGLLCHAAAVEFYRSENSMRYDLLAGPERYKTTLARTSGQTLHWFTLHPPGAVGAHLRRLAERVAARVRPKSVA